MKSIDNMVEKVLDQQEVADFFERPFPLFEIIVCWGSVVLATSTMVYDGPNELNLRLLGFMILAYYVRAIIQSLGNPSWDSLADVNARHPKPDGSYNHPA